MRFTLNLFSILIILATLQVANASECTTCFGSAAKAKVIAEIKKKMKNSDYVIEGNSVYKVNGSGRQKIGDILMVEARFLFEWQDKEYQDYWVDGAGVTKDDMDLILADRGQVYGRGYYVSLHPTDSMGFGSHLTLFEINKPMMFLEYPSMLTFTKNENVLNELRALGIAGVKCTATWLSLINEKYLNKAKRLSATILKDLSNVKNQVPAFTVHQLLSAPSLRALAK